MNTNALALFNHGTARASMGQLGQLGQNLARFSNPASVGQFRPQGQVQMRPNAGFMSPGVARPQGGFNPQAPLSSSVDFGPAIDFLSRKVQQLEAQGGGGAQGGPVYAGSALSNIAAYAAPPIVGKGGILETNFASFAAAAVAGTTATVEMAAGSQARLTETWWELAQVTAEGDLADMDELRKIQVSAYLNGRPIPKLDRVPADALAPTLLSQNLIPVTEYVAADVVLSVTFTVTRDLTTSATSSIGLRVWSGYGETYPVPPELRY